MRYACADRVFTFARAVQSVQLQVLFMANFDSEKPTTEVSSGQSEEDDLFVEVDIDGSNENDDLPAKSSSFLRQLNQSLHTMVGSIMEKSLKRLHEDKTPPAKRKKPRLATETSGPEEVEENQNSDEDTRALCGPSNADSAESSQTINARLGQDTFTDNCNDSLLSEIENVFLRRTIWARLLQRNSLP